MTFAEELKIEKNPAIIKIGEYLWKRSETDPSVANNLQKDGKSLANCYRYIKSNAQKEVMNGCACIEDEVVYGWAVHYYDEDNITVDQKTHNEQSKHTDISKKATAVTMAQKKKEKTANNHKKKDLPIEGQLSLFEV